MALDANRINDWTLADFKSIPKTLDSVPEGARSLVIIPAEADEELHDSGYRCMTLVFFGLTPDPASTPAAPLLGRTVMLGRTQGGHDHLQFYPVAQPEGRSYGTVQASGYEGVEMDCLPGSGMLRVWLGTNNGFSSPYHLFSSASIRPVRMGPDQAKTDLHPDQLKDMRRTMMEWAKKFDHCDLRVALDEAMEGK